MKARSRPKAPIVLPMWIQEGNLLRARREDIEAAILASGLTELEIKRDLGAGYHLMEDALQGKMLDGWDVYHLEGSLMSVEDRKEAFSNFYTNRQIRRV